MQTYDLKCVSSSQNNIKHLTWVLIYMRSYLNINNSYFATQKKKKKNELHWK